MTKPKELIVLLHHKQIGTLSKLSGDKNFFAFSQEYIDDQNRSSLSLSFKDKFGELIPDALSSQTRLPPFFANLLPEGTMREYLARSSHIRPEDEFLLLSALGKDLPGAIQVVLPEEMIALPPTALSKSAKKNDDSSLRFSLAGIQLKFSAVKTADKGWTIPAHGIGGSWIVKLPSQNYLNVPENEYNMMELARRVGIDVPKTALIPLKQIHNLPQEMKSLEKNAFVIQRFDRGDQGELIHIEDFAQVFGVYPEKKYSAASTRNIAEVIHLETGREGITEWIRRFIFNVLIGNGDMHLKNWSLIYPDQKRAKLAPAYDFVSTLPYLPNESLALNFMGSKDFKNVTMQQLARFAAKAKLPEDIILHTTQQTVARFKEVWHKESDLDREKNLKKTLKDHFQTLPLWKEKNLN